MDWKLWVFVITASLVNFGYGLKNSAEIYAKLVDVIRDKSADAENDFLDKHYFTENKSKDLLHFLCFGQNFCSEINCLNFRQLWRENKLVSRFPSGNLQVSKGHI